MRVVTWENGQAVVRDIPLGPITRRQGRAVLGEDACNIIDALKQDPYLPWAMRDAIDSATVWHRDSPEIDELAWLLGLDGPQIDALFVAAMAI